MEVRSFKGGTHIPHYKEYTEKCAIEPMKVPPEVVIPLLMHGGEPNEPLVQVGDRVTVGQKIGDVDNFWNAPIHASVNGVVEAIDVFPSYEVDDRVCIKIRTEGEDHAFKPQMERDPESLSQEELRAIIREAGLVGMGGAAFPTHINISPRSPVDSLLINGAECEPFLTCDHRLMVERADDLLAGARIMMRCIGASRCYIGIEVNKPDAIETLKQKTQHMSDMEVVPLAVKYPQGYKSHLIKAITGRNVPRGARSAELGCVVRNVGTTIAGYEAVVYGKPLIERVVTVSGPTVPKPGNYIIKIGTPVGFALEQCGISDMEGLKVVQGGPMTGRAQESPEAGIVKSSTGLLVLPPELAVPRDISFSDCVRCGKCVDRCPMFLYPNYISLYAEANMIDQMLEWDALDCMDCGICSYSCPSHRSIADMIRCLLPELKNRQKSIY